MNIMPRILEHGELYLRIAFSPDGAFLAVASMGSSHSRSDGKGAFWETNTPGKMILWNTKAWTVQTQLQDDAFNDVKWYPDGKIFATAGRKRITLWDAATGKPRLVFSDVDPPATYREYQSLAFSPDGRIVAICAEGRLPDADVLLLDTSTGLIAQKLVKEDDGRDVLDVRFLPGGHRIIGLSYTYDEIVKAYVWDVVREAFLAELDTRAGIQNLDD